MNKDGVEVTNETIELLRLNRAQGVMIKSLVELAFKDGRIYAYREGLES